MLTIKELTANLPNIDEAKLTGISDKLWALGSLEEIKEKTSPELFHLHVGMNRSVIGNLAAGGTSYVNRQT